MSSSCQTRALIRYESGQAKHMCFGPKRRPPAMTISGRAYCHTATHYAYSCSVDWPSVNRSPKTMSSHELGLLAGWREVTLSHGPRNTSVCSALLYESGLKPSWLRLTQRRSRRVIATLWGQEDEGVIPSASNEQVKRNVCERAMSPYFHRPNNLHTGKQPLHLE